MAGYIDSLAHNDGFEGINCILLVEMNDLDGIRDVVLASCLEIGLMDKETAVFLESPNLNIPLHPPALVRPHLVSSIMDRAAGRVE